MKVLHVLNELKPSGAEVMLLSAAPYWGKNGVSCEILATGETEGEFAETLRGAGYRVHHLPRKKSLSYFIRFKKFIQSNHYDIVHQHAEAASYWFGLASLYAGTNVVRTIHSNFAFKGNLKWRRALQRRHLQTLGTQFVAIATGVQKNERERFGLEIGLVWNWIDIDRFAPLNEEERIAARSYWGFSEEELVIVTVGNCSSAKNHVSLISALDKIRGLKSIRYLHVGLEDSCCSERKLAAALHLEDKIIFCGWLQNPRKALAAADLYVMPSLYEGLGLSALEAASVGIPTLFANVPGLQDLEPLLPGIIFADPTDSGLADAIRAFASLSPEIKTMHSSKYHFLVKEKFSVSRGVAEYCSIYRSQRR